MNWTKALLIFCLSCFAASSRALELDACGDLSNAYGPYDYRTATEAQKHLVEKTHFPTHVEHLQRRATGSFGGDIDYTLRAFPNNPRALLAMMKLGAKERALRPQGARWPVECYFDRAVRFAPDDPAVRTVYGLYLISTGQRQAAERELETAREALKKLGGDRNLSYNLGLAYFNLGNYDAALEQAKTAYALGFPLPGLREKLKRVGKWQESEKDRPDQNERN